MQEETPTRYRVVEVNEMHKKIATAFGAKKLTVPEKGRHQLSEVLASLSAVVSVHSELERAGEHLETVAVDARIHCHITQVGDGFNLSLFVRPFKDTGPYFKPGKGGSHAISELYGKKVQAQRNLDLEKQHAHAAINACPSLADSVNPVGWISSGAHAWMFDNPQD